MKILFAGTTAQAALVLKHLATSMHQVVGVLTREDAPVGRKAVITPSPVAQLASELEFPTFKANRVSAEITRKLGLLEADLGIVIAYGALLKADLLAAPKHGWLNLHYSLLPRWRGAAPVQHAILNGDQDTGVTIFKLDEGMDTGPILSQIQTQIQSGENAGDLLNRLTLIGISALDETLARLEAGIATFSEQSGGYSIAGKLTRLQAQIDWTSDSKSIENLVRAMNPEPMAWTLLEGQSFRVVDARTSDERSEAESGSVFDSAGRILVSCGGETTLELSKVQPAGKSVMNGKDWFRGLTRNAVFGGQDT